MSYTIPTEIQLNKLQNQLQSELHNIFETQRDFEKDVVLKIRLSTIVDISNEEIQSIVAGDYFDTRKSNKTQREKIAEKIGSLERAEQICNTISSKQATILLAELKARAEAIVEQHPFVLDRKSKIQEIENHLEFLQQIEWHYTKIDLDKDERWLASKPCCILENYLRNHNIFEDTDTNEMAMIKIMNSQSRVNLSREPINKHIYERYRQIQKATEFEEDCFYSEYISSIHDATELIDKYETPKAKRIIVKSAKTKQSGGCLETIENAIKLFMLFVTIVFLIIAIIMAITTK